jgi:hypothetical protein
MKMVLVAIMVLSCNSVTAENAARKETIVHACPNTARFFYEERPQSPMDIARMKHYWSLPRDDRPPLPVVEDKPKVEAKKAVKKKTKRKKKRRKS